MWGLHLPPLHHGSEQASARRARQDAADQVNREVLKRPLKLEKLAKSTYYTKNKNAATRKKTKSATIIVRPTPRSQRQAVSTEALQKQMQRVARRVTLKIYYIVFKIFM